MHPRFDERLPSMLRPVEKLTLLGHRVLSEETPQQLELMMQIGPTEISAFLKAPLAHALAGLLPKMSEVDWAAVPRRREYRPTKAIAAMFPSIADALRQAPLPLLQIWDSADVALQFMNTAGGKKIAEGGFSAAIAHDAELAGPLISLTFVEEQSATLFGPWQLFAALATRASSFLSSSPSIREATTTFFEREVGGYAPRRFVRIEVSNVARDIAEPRVSVSIGRGRDECSDTWWLDDIAGILAARFQNCAGVAQEDGKGKRVDEPSWFAVARDAEVVTLRFQDDLSQESPQNSVVRFTVAEALAFAAALEAAMQFAQVSPPSIVEAPLTTTLWEAAFERR